MRNDERELRQILRAFWTAWKIYLIGLIIQLIVCIAFIVIGYILIH